MSGSVTPEVPVSIQTIGSASAETDPKPEFSLDSYHQFCLSRESPVTHETMQRLIFMWPLISLLLHTMRDLGDVIDGAKKFVFYGNRGMNGIALTEMQRAVEFKFNLWNEMILLNNNLGRRLSSPTASPNWMVNPLEMSEVNLQRLIRLIHADFGIGGEAGEIAGALLKALDWKQFDLTNLIEEGGDTGWYLPLLADACLINLGDMLYANQKKLEARYKEKFSTAEAETRDLAAEDEAMKAAISK